MLNDLMSWSSPTVKSKASTSTMYVFFWVLLISAKASVNSLTRPSFAAMTCDTVSFFGDVGISEHVALLGEIGISVNPDAVLEQAKTRQLEKDVRQHMTKLH